LSARLGEWGQPPWRAAALLCVLGVTLAFENCYRGDHEVLRWLMERFRGETVSFCLDTGHANIHGNLNELQGLKERLTVTHIHDNRGDDDSHMPPGWGTVDWEKVNRLIDGVRKNP
jgi:sugar phosphate isomerase/epimerase